MSLLLRHGGGSLSQVCFPYVMNHAYLIKHGTQYVTPRTYSILSKYMFVFTVDVTNYPLVRIYCQSLEKGCIHSLGLQCESVIRNFL